MKKVILTTDQQAINEVYRQTDEAIELLNNFVNQAETVAKVKFSDMDKLSLMANGNEFLTNHFKSKFPIPGATDEFNLQALGVDLEGLLKHNRQDVWQAFKLKLNLDKEFHLDGDPDQLEACYTYVETKKQAEALKLAEDSSDIFNQLCELGYLENRLIHKVKDLGGLLDWELIPGTTNCKIVPNKHYISRLK